MESQQSSLFDLGIDDIGQTHLISIAKWNKFLAWVGIIGCALALLAIIFGGSFFISTFSGLNRNSGMPYNPTGFFSGILIFYALLIVVFMIPSFFRLSFANKMLKALGTNDQQLLNESLGHLKSFSKFWGILTIIIIALYGIVFIIALIGAATLR